MTDFGWALLSPQQEAGDFKKPWLVAQYWGVFGGCSQGSPEQAGQGVCSECLSVCKQEEEEPRGPSAAARPQLALRAQAPPSRFSLIIQRPCLQGKGGGGSARARDFPEVTQPICQALCAGALWTLPHCSVSDLTGF